MSGAPKLPTVRVDNPLNTIVDVATAPIKFGVNVNQTIYDSMKDPLAGALGLETGADRAIRMVQEQNAAEATARSTYYNDALNDRTLDATTRQEIASMYESGADSSSIAAALTQAREGKGVYGIRRINENQAAIKKDMPGRGQLFSLGASPILGGVGGTR